MAAIHELTDTWNDAGTVFDALHINVTDTASDAESMPFRASVGGVDKFAVRKDSRIRYGPDANNHWTHLVSATGDLALTGVGGGGGGAFSVTPAAGKHVIINFNNNSSSEFIVTNSSSGNLAQTRVSLTNDVGVKAFLSSYGSGHGGSAFGLVLANRTIIGTLSGSLGLIVGTGTASDLTLGTNSTAHFTITAAGLIGVGVSSGIVAKAHVSQPSTTAAIPVLRLNQADLSEEMIRFESTVGVGNPIEAVGAKAFTPTHFVRVHIQGVGNLYMQAGTIA